MAGINKCTFIGNLGADPETRFSAGGSAITKIRIAVSESWKDKQGQKQERTEWVRATFFGRLAEIAGEYLKKGSTVYIEGRMQTSKYQASDGSDRYSTEIVANEMQMLGGRPEGGTQRPQQAPAQQAASGADGFDDSDSIPF